MPPPCPETHRPAPAAALTRILLLPLLVAGCIGTGAGPVELRDAATGPEVVRVGPGGAGGPPGAAPGTCHAEEVTPAVVETVTEQVIDRPARRAPDGSLLAPAIYRTETHQKIVRERRAIWIEVPCDEVQTIEFVASVQRALKARGLYAGPITAIYDAPTRAAIRAYQARRGLDSDILALETARELGLIALAR